MKLLDDFRITYHSYFFDRKVIKEFLRWLVEHNLDGSWVDVNLETHKGKYIFKEGLLISRGNSVAVPKNIFYLYKPDIDLDKTDHKQSNFLETFIFKSPFLCVKEIYSNNNASCLRRDLTIAEKKQAVFTVRENIKKVLFKQEILNEKELAGIFLFNIFQEPATIGVVLWVDGNYRGSVIYNGSSLIEAILACSFKVIKDKRFKPIKGEDLDNLRIEINILSDLHIPLPKKPIGSGLILTDKVYMAQCESKSGLLLPTIFNTCLFKNHSEFLDLLIVNKAGITPKKFKNTRVSVLEVESFIESHDLKNICDMNGSLIKINEPNLDENTIKVFGNELADYVCNQQDKDGFIPQIFDVYTHMQTKADWVRMSFIAFALATYGVYTEQEKYISVAKKTQNYIERVFPKLQFLSNNESLLVNAYLGRLSILLNEKNRASKYIDIVDANQQLSVPPMMRLQLAVFFYEMVEERQSLLAVVLKIVNDAFLEWEKLVSKNKELSLAEYAELLSLLKLLSVDKKINDATLLKNYNKIKSWYLSCQNFNGSFPSTTNSWYQYTRGTSKVLESISLDKDNTYACRKSISWLKGLQYKTDSMFGVPLEKRSLVMNALMHDDMNHSVWVDSVGHTLIGVGRFLNINY